MARPLADEVHDHLRTWIVDAVREPGVRLNIESVARELEVSPTPVREALSRLEAEGLVVKEPNRGWSIVPPLSTSAVEELFGLRLLLEPWAAGEAAARIDRRGAARLRAELRTCPTAPASGSFEDYRAIVEHDQRFHDLVLELAGNEQVRAAFARTNCHVHLFRLSYGSSMGTEALAEHRAVVEAVVGGERGAAERAMRRHLTRARARLRERPGG